MMALRRFEKGWLAKRAIREWVATADGKGQKSAEVGTEFGEIELWIDTDSIIRQLGHRALVNESGVSCLMQGAMEICLIQRRQERS